MGALQDGDTVFDEHGQPCTVVQAHEVLHHRPCYKVTFSDGTEVIADEDHLWLTWNRRERKNAIRNAKSDATRVRDWGPPRNDQPKARTTAEIRETLMVNRGRKERNHSIPNCAPLVLPDADLPIDPYVLGLWLGDGHSAGPMMTCADEDMADAISAAYPTLTRKTSSGNTGKATTYHWTNSNEHAPGSNTFRNDLRALNLLHNKHIPDIYQRASAEQRLALVQGLMDTDGSVDPKSACEFTTTSRALADGMLELLIGLGVRVKILESRATLYGKDCGPKYRLLFNTNRPVFRLPRKAAKLQRLIDRRRFRVDHRFIESVEPVPSVPVRCITVDSPSRLYLCSRAMIPTHNTATGIRTACEVALAGQPVGWFAPSYKIALEAWRELVDRLAAVTSRMNEQDKRLELVTGGVIEVWTLDTPDPARGRKYALAVIDEAGIVRELLEVWQAAIRPTLVDLSGKALFLGTPKGRRHGFITLFNRGAGDDPDWQAFRASTLENPYIPAEEVETARKELPPEVFAQEFEGIPTDDGANPFGLEAIRAAILPIDETTARPPVVIGLDLARSTDYTVLVGLDAWRRVVLLERWQSPWAATKARVKALVGAVPTIGDATGVGDAIVADLQTMDVPVTPHVFTQSSKLRLMQRLIAAFQGKELTLPNTPEAAWLVAELEAFEFTYTEHGVRYEAPSGLHDDGVMALALALHGWDRVQGVVPEADPAQPLLPFVPRDPYVEDGASGPSRTLVAGVFTQQLPGEW